MTTDMTPAGERASPTIERLADHTAVEVKAKRNVTPRDLRSLRAFGEERPKRRRLCVSLEPRRRRVGDVTILPYREFLEALWDGEYSA